MFHLAHGLFFELMHDGRVTISIDDRRGQGQERASEESTIPRGNRETFAVEPSEWAALVKRLTFNEAARVERERIIQQSIDDWKEKAIGALRRISADMENDAEAFDGRPFNGRTVAEYFGIHGAAIAAVAHIVQRLLQDQRSESPQADAAVSGALTINSD